MGGAWLQKLATTNIYDQIDKIHVVQPSMAKQEAYKDYNKIAFLSDANKLGSNYMSDIVIIAIKPQIFAKVLLPLQSILSESLLLSIAAGKTINEIQKYTANNRRIVRIMPNIGMSIGQSANLLYTDKITESDKVLVESLLESTGKQYWLDSELEIDKLTPITGCAPAFYYKLSMELVNCGVEAGFSHDLVMKLVSDTFRASASYSSNDQEFKNLIDDVASKGGVTRAALEVMNSSIHEIILKAYDAAIDRIKELKEPE